MSTEHQHQYLHPSVLKDASTGTAGLIAGELAAEEASLLGRSQDAESASYGAAETRVLRNQIMMKMMAMRCQRLS